MKRKIPKEDKNERKNVLQESHVFFELKNRKIYDEEFLNKNSRPMMNILRTTLHENPRALYAFSAK